MFKMSPEDQIKYCTDNKVRSMLSKVITTGYNMLHLISFFTCGADEVKAWTVHVSTNSQHISLVIRKDEYHYHMDIVSYWSMMHTCVHNYNRKYRLKPAAKKRQC